MLLFTGVVSACSNNGEVTEYNYLFTGEGEYWSAELRYETEEAWEKDDEDVNMYSSESDYIFTLTYKGALEEIASMEQLNYKYELGTTGAGSASLTFDELVTDKEFISRGGGSGANMRMDMVVSVEVEWDDHEESFKLDIKQ